MPRVLVNWTNGAQRELDKKGFYVAECCNGQRDFESLAFLPEHHALLDKLIGEGTAEVCREGDSIEVWQRYRRADNPRLTGIHWCVTGLCNLNCRHCYMESPAGRYGELPFESMARLVGQLERANVVEVLVTGGEPFLRNDLLSILRLLAERKIRVSEIYSNGLLITEEHLEGIREIGVSPTFQISFDGVGGHDWMRGTKGIEQRAIDAIRRLRVADFAVAVATSIDKSNIGRLPDTYELMKRLDVQCWIVVPPQRSGNWRTTTTAVSLNEEAEAYAPLLNGWLKDGKPFNIHLGHFFRARQPGPESRAGIPGQRMAAEAQDGPIYTPDSYDCGACREQPNLLPDGALVPCPGYVDSPLHERAPNLLQQDLSSVWSHSLLRQIADRKKKDVLPWNPECDVCELFKVCGIGCRASALRETGDVMGKDPVSCDLWKKGYKKRFQELAGFATTKH